MKKVFTLFVALTVVITLMALPAYRGGITKQQPDGSTMQVFMHGDEHFHYLTNAAGEWLTLDENGFYVVTKALTEKEISEKRMSSPMMKSQILRSQQKTPIALNISPYGLIILVNFQDVSFQDENISAMNEMHNGENYTHNGATGSVRKYFYDQSMGKYNPQFEIVGPVTISQERAYYGTNNAQGNDQHPGQMVAEACRLADAQFDIDFTKYDNDNDGNVDFVYIIYAGQCEAETQIAEYVWPHAWDLYSAGETCNLDDKRIHTYACGPELKLDNTRSGIGTFCHEFSHVCGLPDLYATNGSTHKTLGSWDILDYGPYNNNGNTPSAYSAYERFFCGWLTPTYLYASGNVTLNELQSSNTAYIITESEEPDLKGNDPNPTTFYLLENRQQTSWDTYIPGHGLMITKIQYDFDKWWNNTVNDDSENQGVDLIEASPNNDKFGKDVDLFPTGAESYSGIENRLLDNITEANSVISFDFDCILASGTCGTQGGNITWKLSCDGVMTLSGNGDTGDFQQVSSCPWNKYKSKEIKSIVIEEGITRIGDFIFDGCHSLTSVELPNSLRNIGKEAFSHCTSLTSMEIPDGVTSLGNNVLYGCNSLTSFEIPNSVTSIGVNPIGNCDNIVSVSVASGNTKYDSRNNCNAIIQTSTKTLVAGCQNTVIPDNVTIIGTMAFEGCRSMTTINLPNSIIEIQSRAFMSCGLTSIEIPAGVATIGDNAFNGCSSLGKATAWPVKPPTITSDAFSNVETSKIPLYVPAKSVSAYKRAAVWKEFDIQEMTTTYKVTFLDQNGEQIEVLEVAEGEDAVAPEIIAPEGYKFIGWEGGDLTNIQSDVAVKARFATIFTTPKGGKYIIRPNCTQ